MSNNKQTMKLYTEEEIINYLINHKSTITRYDLQNIPHIQLPSDEEIEKESEWLDNPLERLNFQEGIKWLRDNLEGLKNLPLGSTLEGGNNEQQ